MAALLAGIPTVDGGLICLGRARTIDTLAKRA